MDFKKGMYRLSIIAAVIVGLTGFVLGWGLYVMYIDEHTPKQPWKRYSGEVLPTDPAESRPPRDLFDPKYKSAPPLYKTLGVATLSASLCFFITLFGIRGSTLLLLWVVSGFREQKKGSN